MKNDFPRAELVHLECQRHGIRSPLVEIRLLWRTRKRLVKKEIAAVQTGGTPLSELLPKSRNFVSAFE